MRVLVQANFICRKCGEEGMDAHHKKSWKEYPELRFDVSNGECLCEDCHNKTKNFNKSR